MERVLRPGLDACGASARIGQRDRIDHAVEGNAEEVSRREHGASRYGTRSHREDDRGISCEVGTRGESCEYPAVAAQTERQKSSAQNLATPSTRYWTLQSRNMDC